MNRQKNISQLVLGTMGILFISFTSTWALDIKFTNPQPGSAVSDVSYITIVASDPSGISKLELYIDGRLHGSEIASPYIFKWDTAWAIDNGPHTLLAKGVSVSGQRAETTINVTVQNTQPVMDFRVWNLTYLKTDANISVEQNGRVLSNPLVALSYQKSNETYRIPLIDLNVVRLRADFFSPDHTELFATCSLSILPSGRYSSASASLVQTDTPQPNSISCKMQNEVSRAIEYRDGTAPRGGGRTIAP